MKPLATIFWIGVAILLVLYLSFASYHSTDSTEVGVRTVKWFGAKGVENRVYQPGAAYFFLPIFSDWDTFDTRLQVVEMKNANQLTIKTRDDNDLFVDVTFSYRIDPQKAPFIRQYVAKSDLEIRAQIEAQREANKRMLNEAEGQVKSMIASVQGLYSNTLSAADAELDQKKTLAQAILTEGTNTSLSIAKQREAMASAGGETQIQLAFATNLLHKRIIMIPSGSGVNLQTLDLNRALESILKK